MSMHGCDLSGWQTETPVGYDFYIIKASEGDGFKDSRLDAHYNAVAKMGKPYGFYHYARPDLGNTPEQEADWFLSLVGHHAGKCVYALDWEGNSLNYPAEWVLRWMKRVFEKTGVKPMFYCSEYFISTGKYKPIADYNCGLWMAQYANEPTLPPESGWTNIAIWQSGDSPVDLDVFYGDRTAWDKYCHKAGEHKPDPKPTPAPLDDKKVLRLYNKKTGYHFYTISGSECSELKKSGWTFEGVGWLAPASSKVPVTRLYKDGKHFWTISKDEADNLINAGWKKEGTAFFSGGIKPVYRLINNGIHFWTSSKGESDTLAKKGWKIEGIAFYAK